MQIRPTAFTIGLIIHFSIALFCVYTEFGIDLGCEMISFRGEIPEWYFKMVFAILSFPEGNIGEYFAKQNIIKE